MLALAVAALGAGTFAFRWAGPALRNRIRFPDRAVRLLEIGAVVLLAALAAVTTLPLGSGRIGPALPAGVLVAGLLAWRRAPLPIVIAAAAATTALIRLFGEN
ncbi:AzlD domain-containing protein [Nocardia bovistercoris]|uniref:AzlD domain-containing protein n=1 Tax=Nocardia bovistercoris TaxID=2785916 RepID=A0A931IC18_9NOCA|nr:AzlD domain-containing protein [Nocardia bovistercoris]MBH0777085.1 AzlD domain-containing protein [Nocardia bovistercoris]